MRKVVRVNSDEPLRDDEARALVADARLFFWEHGGKLVHALERHRDRLSEQPEAQDEYQATLTAIDALAVLLSKLKERRSMPPVELMPSTGYADMPPMEAPNPTSLAKALPREMTRVRGLIPMYQSIGQAGAPAILMMNRALDAAQKAMAEGDVVAMLRAYEELKGFHE